MEKFLKDVKKYGNYALFSARSELKAEVAGSFLSWAWWILDPLLHMLIYSFIAIIVFKSPEPYFPVFVFIGLNVWQFFSKTIRTAVNLIKTNRMIVTKVYIPKYIFLFEKMWAYGLKMFISFMLTAVFMIIYGVPVTLNIFWIIPLLLLLFLFTFAISVIVMHFGVFVEDLLNITTVLLQLWFYVSGVFYSIESRIGDNSVFLAKIMSNLNPIALIISNIRTAVFGTGEFNFIAVLVWTLASVLVSVFGISLVYKYENSYVKVI